MFLRFFEILNFSESFRVYKFFRKWCSMCCSAPMTDVSLSRALLFIPLIRTLIRLASWHIFERYFFFPLCEFLSRFIKFLELFLELWTSENLGIGTSVSIKPVDKLLPGGEYFCLDAELGWGRAHTRHEVRGAGTRSEAARRAMKIQIQ